MNCTDYQEHLSAYLDRALPPTEQTAVAHHVEDCAACQADVAALLKVKEFLRAHPMPSIPLDLVAEIEAQTVLRPARWAWAEGFLRWAPLATGALAMALWASTIFQNARLQMHEPRVPLQSLLARRTGHDWSFEDERRVAVHHVSPELPDEAPTPPPETPPQP